MEIQKGLEQELVRILLEKRLNQWIFPLGSKRVQDLHECSPRSKE